MRNLIATVLTCIFIWWAAKGLAWLTGSTVDHVVLLVVLFVVIGHVPPSDDHP